MSYSKLNLNLLSVALLTAFALSGCTNLKFSKSKHPYTPPAALLKHKKLALVLGGGGAKGMAHVGVLEELEKSGIRPDVIIGCSAGAIVGSLYAANPDSQALKDLVLPGKKSDVIQLSTEGWPYSIYSRQQLAAYLRQHLHQHDFAQLKIPLIVTATNLQFGTTAAFGQGDVIDAVIASAALPGAFAPVKIADQYFVDCSVADPVPVRLARSLGFEVVVAVNIAEQLSDKEPNNLFGVMQRSIEIAYINQSKYSVEGADVIIDFEFKNMGLFTDAYNQYLYDQGLLAGKKAVPLIKKKLYIKE